MRTAIFTFTACVIFLGGCSSGPKVNFNYEPRRVTIITEPEAATVYQVTPVCQSVYPLGLSPVQDRSVMVVTKITKMRNMGIDETRRLLEQVDNVVVRIEKEGFEPYYGTLRTDPKETVVHTIKLLPKQAK